MEAGLYALVSGASTITALVGGNVFPVAFPEGFSALPAITYSFISGKFSPTLETSGMQRLRVEFNGWAPTYGAAVAIRAALKTLLDGYQGPLSDGTFLQDVQVSQIGEAYEHDALAFRAMIEFYLFFD